MKENIKEAFRLAWIILHLLELIFLCLWLKINGFSYVWFPVALIVLWWSITMTALRISEKREQRRRETYRAKYITQLTLTDERFGSIIFDYDAPENRLEADPCELPPFGNGKPFWLTVQIADETTPDEALTIAGDVLHAFYARESEVIKACCESVKETYDDEDLRDEHGAPISIESIREALRINGFEISINRHWHGVTVEVHGDMDNDFRDHIDEHGVTVELCKETGSDQWHFS